MKQYDVFISHSAKDKLVADALVHYLEEHQVRCWVSPRDMPENSASADVIEGAIRAAKLLLVLISCNTQHSQLVHRELELAVAMGKMVIPVRVEDVLPRKALRFYLHETHWVDVFPNPEENFDRVLSSLMVMLDVENPYRLENGFQSRSNSLIVAKSSQSKSAAFKRKLDLHTIIVLFVTIVIPGVISVVGLTLKGCEHVKYIDGFRWRYAVNMNGVSICQGHTVTPGILEIPLTIDGRPVISIGYGAFKGCESMTEVVIPSGVVDIGADAFAWCKNLESVTLPLNLSGIGDGAFRGCRELTMITIPRSVKRIGDEAFSDCENLKSVTIPSSVSSIGALAFAWCGNLDLVFVDDGDDVRVKGLMKDSGLNVAHVAFVVK